MPAWLPVQSPTSLPLDVSMLTVLRTKSQQNHCYLRSVSLISKAGEYSSSVIRNEKIRGAMKLASVITMEGKYCTKRLAPRVVSLTPCARWERTHSEEHSPDIMLCSAILQPLLSRIQLTSCTQYSSSSCICNCKLLHCSLLLHLCLHH